jgi:CheY-like chemotaxis protein
MSLKVLIVEDEQIVSADLQSTLTRMGHEVVGSAASAEDALLLAHAAKPDIVLMDIQLQGPLSGLEAANQIQLQTSAQVIFITAFAGVFLRDPTRMTPPGMCLTKPFSPYQLQVALESVRPQSQSQA